MIRAGLVTREQLAAAIAKGPLVGGALAAALIGEGLDEDALAGFFLSEGLGPLLDARGLQHINENVAGKIPAEMARALVALPVRMSPSGIVVAMIDPSDKHALGELERALHAQVVPATSRLSDLSAAIDRAWPAPARPEVAPVEVPEPEPEPEEEAPVQLVRRRSSETNLASLGFEGSTKGVDREAARAALGPTLAAPDFDDEIVPLVRTKPIPSPPAGIARDGAQAGVSPKTFRRPSDTGIAAWAKPARIPPPPPAKNDAEKPPRQATAAYARMEEPARAEPATEAQPTPAESAPIVVTLPSPVESKPKAPAPAPPAAKPVAPAPTAAKAAPAPAAAAAPEQATRAAREALDTVAAPAAPAKPVEPAPSVPPADEDRWGDLSTPAVATSSPAPSSGGAEAAIPVADAKLDGSRRRLLGPSRPSAAPTEIGAVLAGIRASRDRDEVVRLACEGAATVARAAVFMALRKDTLKGWEGCGDGLTHASLRNLWIPAASPSMFKQVVEHQVPYAGPAGTTAADTIFRAAIRSRGGDVLIQPVMLQGKLIGVLYADDVKYGLLGRERVEVMSAAIADAFARIIVTGKSG